jgi:hypothetical protein
MVKATLPPEDKLLSILRIATGAGFGAQSGQESGYFKNFITGL